MMNDLENMKLALKQQMKSSRQRRKHMKTRYQKKIFTVAVVTFLLGFLFCTGCHVTHVIDLNDTLVNDTFVNDTLVNDTEAYALPTINDVKNGPVEVFDAQQQNHSPLTDEEWETLVEACVENKIDTSLVLGLIWVESRFQPNAVSSCGSYGYCQINPRWHPAELSPVENIRYGVNYLASCISRYDNLEAGLTAYHAGYDTGRRWYANAVLEAAKEWE